MSIKINIDSLDEDIRQKIHKELIIVLENSKYNQFAPKKEIYPFNILNDDIYLPFAYSITDLSLKRKERKMFSDMIVKFEGTLRAEQEEVKKESLTYLSKLGSIIISLGTGMGKTITSINLACNIKLKTLVIVNKIVLINQWEESIKRFCPSAIITKITNKTTSIEDSDFSIINAMNIEKKPKNFFNDIGLCIVDELHNIMAESLSKSLFYVSPRYLIGLSATPYRTDGLQPLIDFYFGKNKIIRLLNREHTVYKVKTGFKPKVELAENGKINWGALINEQCLNTDRNELIIKIVKKFHMRNILIMSKRIEQSEYIYSRLLEEKESVTNLIGKKQEFDKEARILVATVTKTGTGFDHPKLDCLILASDLESYFVQILGRVLRKPDVKPLVFDLVDENPILEKHFKTRKSTYLDIGGKIVDFNKVFPDIKN
jgi:superfamily II DNA or RNA helicase